MTNLGALLQQALAAQQTTQQPVEVPMEGTTHCADCWNALTFKDEGGRQMARCSRDLWVKASVTLEQLNAHKVKRWYVECPAYDDSE